MGAADFLSIAAHGSLHRQGGVTGAHGVVFMRHRCTEERHDAVAQHLVPCLPAVHGVHHVVQGRIEEPLGDFRVEIANQLRGPFEIGKEHRDQLAFAFQGAFGRQDLLGQIGGRVGERRGYVG